MSVSHERLLLLKNATVNWNLGFDDVCKQKYVYAAINQQRHTFEVSSTGEILENPAVQPYLSYVNLAHEWELQAAFLKSNNIKPHWLNANYNWGTLNKTTGQWSGAVGMIQRDEADYAIFGFLGTYARSKVAAFSPGVDYSPLHWLTRYPLELPPTWNLLGLFTKGYISQTSSNLNIRDYRDYIVERIFKNPSEMDGCVFKNLSEIAGFWIQGYKVCDLSTAGILSSDWMSLAWPSSSDDGFHNTHRHQTKVPVFCFKLA